jgi:hypothetical protein
VILEGDRPDGRWCGQSCARRLRWQQPPRLRACGPASSLSESGSRSHRGTAMKFSSERTPDRHKWSLETSKAVDRAIAGGIVVLVLAGAHLFGLDSSLARTVESPFASAGSMGLSVRPAQHQQAWVELALRSRDPLPVMLLDDRVHRLRVDQQPVVCKRMRRRRARQECSARRDGRLLKQLPG